MSPKRYLLSRDARTVLDELGIDLFYVDGGLVWMGGTEGSPYSPASMESVEDACAAVHDAGSFRDEAHRFEVFLARLDSEQGPAMAPPRPEPLGQTLRSLGAASPNAVVDGRTPELSRWERILYELRPDRPRRPRRRHSRRTGAGE